MSAPGTKPLDGEISKYLNRNAVAVDLPDKRKDEEHGPPETYPPLIIDGASGTGKTQQAFALVKKHKTIIYFLMSDPPKGDIYARQEQKIYRSMRELTMDEHERRFVHRVDEAIKALGEDEYYKTEERISYVSALCSALILSRNIAIDYDPVRGLWARKADSDERWAWKADSRVNWRNALVDVVLWMCSKHLQWDKVGGLRVVPIQLEGTPDVSFEDLNCQLENVILFLDEAGFSGGDDRLDPGAIDRLRFVRNVGKALNMRVVLAGTAATAANLIADPEPPKTSVGGATRSGGVGDLAWMECLFLWKTMSEEDVKSVVLPELASPNDLQSPPNDWELALVSELEGSRPYLVHLFGRVVNGRHINSRTFGVAARAQSSLLKFIVSSLAPMIASRRKSADISIFVIFILTKSLDCLVDTMSKTTFVCVVGKISHTLVNFLLLPCKNIALGRIRHEEVDDRLVFLDQSEGLLSLSGSRRTVNNQRSVRRRRGTFLILIIPFIGQINGLNPSIQVLRYLTTHMFSSGGTHAEGSRATTRRWRNKRPDMCVEIFVTPPPTRRITLRCLTKKGVVTSAELQSYVDSCRHPRLMICCPSSIHIVSRSTVGAAQWKTP